MDSIANWQDRSALTNLVGRHFRVQRTEDGLECIPLRGGRGDVQLHGPAVLGAYIMSKSPSATIRAVTSKCPAAHVSQEGDCEVIIEHPLDGWQEFLRAVGAKTCRRLSAEHARSLDKGGRLFRFGHGSEEANNLSESTLSP